MDCLPRAFGLAVIIFFVAQMGISLCILWGIDRLLDRQRANEEDP